MDGVQPALPALPLASWRQTLRDCQTMGRLLRALQAVSHSPHTDSRLGDMAHSALNKEQIDRCLLALRDLSSQNELYLRRIERLQQRQTELLSRVDRDEIVSLTAFFHYLDSSLPPEEGSLEQVQEGINQCSMRALQQLLSSIKEVEATFEQLSMLLQDRAWQQLLSEYQQEKSPSNTTIDKPVLFVKLHASRIKALRAHLSNDSLSTDTINHLFAVQGGNLADIISKEVQRAIDECYPRELLRLYLLEKRRIEDNSAEPDQLLEEVDQAIEEESSHLFSLEKLERQLNLTEGHLQSKVWFQAELIDDLWRAQQAQLSPLLSQLPRQQLARQATQLPFYRQLIARQLLKEESLLSPACLEELEQLLRPPEKPFSSLGRSLLDGIEQGKKEVTQLRSELEAQVALLAEQQEPPSWGQQLAQLLAPLRPGCPKEGSAIARESSCWRDLLSFLKLYYLGNPVENVCMGIRLLQAVKQELLHRPSKEKKELLQEIALFYSMVQHDDARAMVKSALERDLYIDHLIGDKLPDQPLEKEEKGDQLLRLQQLIKLATQIITIHQGITKVPIWLYPLTFVGGPLTLAIPIISVLSTVRQVEHIRAARTALSRYNKRWLLRLFIQVDQQYERLGELLEEQYRSRLYSLITIRQPSPFERLWHNLKRSAESYWLELSLAQGIGEYLARIAKLVLAPLLLLLELALILQLTTAALVLSPLACLAAGNELLQVILRALQNSYLLHRTFGQWIDEAYEETSSQVQREMNRREFIRYWQDQLAPMVEQLIQESCEAMHQQVALGQRDGKVASFAGLSMSEWQQLSPLRRESLSQAYCQERQRQIANLIKELAVRQFIDQSELSGSNASVDAITYLQSVDQSFIRMEGQEQIVNLLHRIGLQANEEQLKESLLDQQIASPPEPIPKEWSETLIKDQLRQRCYLHRQRPPSP